MATPGLAYTPSAADSDNTQDIGAGTLVEMGKGKGMNVSGKVPLSPADTAAVLENMQAILDERKSPMNIFLGGLQRASAWGSGGTQGPAATLTAMDRERELERQNDLAMQQNIAVMKAQQASRQGFQTGLGYGTQPQAQQGQAGAVGQPQAGGMQIPDYQKIISSLPPNFRPDALRAVQTGDEASWKAIIAAAEKNKSPELRTLDVIREMPEGPEKNMLMNQAFKDAMANRTYISPKGEIPYTPDYAPVPSGMRGAETPTTGGGVDLRKVAIDAGIPADAIISDYRDPTKQLSLIHHEDPNKPGTYLTKEGRPVALPGKSAHQIPGGAIDIKPSFPITPVQEKALLQAGAVKVAGDPNHFQLPVSGMKAQLAAKEAPVPTETVGGFDPRSKEAKEMIGKGVSADDETIRKSIQEPLLTQNKAERDLPSDIDRTLSVLDKTRTGPGASTAKLVTEMKGFFKELSPAELQGLINAKTIEQTQAKMVASGIKGAYGAQLSDKEGDRYIKTLFTLDDPKDFIRATLELKKAAVYANRDLEQYLLKHPVNKAEAYARYNDENNGARTAEIMRKHAPFVYQKMQEAEKKGAATVEQPAAKPNLSNEAAKRWLEQNPNDPDAPAVRKKLGL